MAYTYIHIVENYFVKPSRGGYVLGTLQTKKGGRRSLMNVITMVRSPRPWKLPSAT